MGEYDHVTLDRKNSIWGLVALSLLSLVSLVYRWPAIVGARGLHSDAAVVGLQATHLLRGEVSPFLWGSGYQTSVDVLVAGVAFAAVGTGATALLLSSLTLHIALMWVAHATLRRTLPPLEAAVATLPLVFTSAPVHTYVLSPPRQASLTLAMVAVWLLDGAAGSRRARAALALGAFCSMGAVYADPYALLFAPVLALIAGFSIWEAPCGERGGRLTAWGAGMLVGAVPVALLWRHADATAGPRSLTFAVVSRNARLLVDECLPWVLGAKVWRGETLLDYAPWTAPWPLRAIGLLGAVVAIGGILTGGVLAFGSPKLRRLGLAGAAMFPVTLGAFVLSPMVSDAFAARYLVAIPLFMPFAIAPWIARSGAAWGLLWLSPALAATAVCGFVGYSHYDGPEADNSLRRELHAQGIHHAVADYWAAYRLTFLYGEDPLVVPLHAAEDRYPPYRAAVRAAPRCAYLHDPKRSREVYDPRLGDLLVGGVHVRIVSCSSLEVHSSSVVPKSLADAQQ